MSRLKRPVRRHAFLSRTRYTKVFIALIFGTICGLLFSYISKQCFLRVFQTNCKFAARRPRIRPSRSTEQHLNISAELNTSKFFLLIGIMTADRFIPTRAKTIQETWANSTVRSVKIIYFSGEQGNNSLGMDIIRLERVDDTYPPQKKSFCMLKYIYENYVDQFHWFLRADDDVYIRIERVSELLQGFSSSQDLLFGQAGIGKSDEKGKLGLSDGDNFCIGGVGVVMSQSLVRKIAPYLLTCLNQTASLHEDVELGRCIRRHIGAMCPWAQEIQHLFYQNFKNSDQTFAGSLSKSLFRNAITVHPIKKPLHMLRLHHHFLTTSVISLQHRAAILNNRIRKTRNLLRDYSTNESQYFEKSYFNGLLPHNCTIPWEFLNTQYLYGLTEPPFTWLSGPLAAAVGKLNDMVMSNINMEAHRLLNSPEVFKKLHLAMLRTHPTLGLQLTVVDLETLLKPLTSERARRVRRARHFSHFEQSFAPFLKNTLAPARSQYVHFIVPLAGRFNAFRRFLNSFEKAFLNPGLSVGLLIVYFPDISSAENHKNFFQNFRAKHSGIELSWSELFGEFSRARALDFGMRRHQNDSLLFFADIDLVFETGFYHRCQEGAIFGQRVYFPLMFSQFNPKVLYYNQPAPPEESTTRFTPPWTTKKYTTRVGVWRKYSFGPVCVYANDVISVGGLNTTIRGWGLEDLDFFEKCLRHGLEVFRAPDLGLVHVYHAQTSCLDSRMNSKQAEMCEDSRRRGIGSEDSLVEYMLAKGYL